MLYLLTRMGAARDWSTKAQRKVKQKGRHTFIVKVKVRLAVWLFQEALNDSARLF